MRHRSRPIGRLVSGCSLLVFVLVATTSGAQAQAVRALGQITSTADAALANDVDGSFGIADSGPAELTTSRATCGEREVWVTYGTTAGIERVKAPALATRSAHLSFAPTSATRALAGRFIDMLACGGTSVPSPGRGRRPAPGQHLPRRERQRALQEHRDRGFDAFSASSEFKAPKGEQ